MDIEEENKRLSQIQHIDKFKKKHKATDMVTVYFSKIHDSYNRGIYSVLVPINSAEKILSKYEWSFQGYEGKPNTEIFCYEGDDKEYIEYLRFGNFDEMEPLIICHDGIALSEEFRLFHKLYYDKKSSNYFQRDDDGNQTIIVKFSQEKIEIRLKELKQFLAVKDKYLLVQFDFIEYSQCLLEDIDPINTDVQIENLMTYRIGLGDMPFCCDGLNTISRLLGKYLIEPYPKEQSDFGDYKIKKIKQCCDFIIDVDDFGQEIILNANVSSLDYLTRVCFRKKVLDKYYSEPSKYSVEESYLRAVDLWGIQIDNHHDDKVYVWLGDLGRDLSYEEQLYWRSFNIPPEGNISKEFAQQQLMVIATDSENLTHKFKRQYKCLQKICSDVLGEYLLLPLEKNNEHYFDSLRIPATNEQKHFDEQILNLTKVLIDSLNEKYLNTLLTVEQLSILKGSISKLESVLITSKVNEIEPHIYFLRNLQGLRSSSVAHRKGSNYKKISQQLELDSKSLQVVLSEILKKSVDFIEFIYTQIKLNNIKKLSG